MDKLTQTLILPIAAILADFLVVSPILDAPHLMVLSMQAVLVTLHARLVADMAIAAVVMILLSMAQSIFGRLSSAANAKPRA